jgi:hypothetical protein
MIASDGGRSSLDDEILVVRSDRRTVESGSSESGAEVADDVTIGVDGLSLGAAVDGVVDGASEEASSESSADGRVDDE